MVRFHVTADHRPQTLKRLALFSCVLTCWSFGVAVAWASDSTIPCSSPPDSGASVAVHAGTQVTTTQDSQKKTCTFSINGAVANSPPAGEVLAALNQFRGPAKLYLRDSKVAILAIAALAAAAAPVDNVPSELVNLLSNFEQPLMQCLQGFSMSSFSTRSFGEGSFSCRGIDSYRNDEEKKALVDSFRVAVVVPNLAISLNWGRFRSVVYLPVVLERLPPLR